MRQSVVEADFLKNSIAPAVRQASPPEGLDLAICLSSCKMQ